MTEQDHVIGDLPGALPDSSKDTPREVGSDEVETPENEPQTDVTEDSDDDIVSPKRVKEPTE